jgi:tRNA threonylcarbamoyladenosine biosynthesis protein TsaE
MTTKLEPIELIREGADATRRLGEALGRWAPDGTVFLLHGDLGAGKTTLTQGIAAGMGVAEPVQSPTFTLVGEHEGRSLRLFHLDLYRLSGPDELESLGFEQFLEPEGAVTVIEWPERAGQWLPDAYLLVELSSFGPDRRKITIRSVGEVHDSNGLQLALRLAATEQDAYHSFDRNQVQTNQR